MKKLINIWIAGMILVTFAGCKESGKADRQPIAVLGAFRDEIRLLEEALTYKEAGEIAGIKYTRGILQGKDVVIAYTGIGKVNAAMTTSLIIENLDPSRIIFTGIAGGIDTYLSPTDIVIAESCVHHDLNYIYGDTLISYIVSDPVTGFENPLYYKSDTLMLALLRDKAAEIILEPYQSSGLVYQPKIIFGIVATGDAFVASENKKKELTSRFGASAVEMEGAAVAQVCYQLNVPFIVIRSISDSANEDADADLDNFFEAAAANANKVVLSLLEMLENDQN